MWTAFNTTWRLNLVLLEVKMRAFTVGGRVGSVGHGCPGLPGKPALSLSSFLFRLFTSSNVGPRVSKKDICLMHSYSTVSLWRPIFRSEKKWKNFLKYFPKLVKVKAKIFHARRNNYFLSSICSINYPM